MIAAGVAVRSFWRPSGNCRGGHPDRRGGTVRGTVLGSLDAPRPGGRVGAQVGDTGG